MKKLLTILAVCLVGLLWSSFAIGWTLNWTASSGAAGYQVSYKILAASTYTQVDAGNVVQWTIPSTLIKGTRYEFFIQAYVGTPRSYSGDSDHIRWTFPTDPVIIEVPYQSPPTQIIINVGP